jgi:hypothetical protein
MKISSLNFLEIDVYPFIHPHRICRPHAHPRPRITLRASRHSPPPSHTATAGATYSAARLTPPAAWLVSPGRAGSTQPPVAPSVPFRRRFAGCVLPLARQRVLRPSSILVLCPLRASVRGVPAGGHCALQLTCNREDLPRSRCAPGVIDVPCFHVRSMASLSYRAVGSIWLLDLTPLFLF